MFIRKNCLLKNIQAIECVFIIVMFLIIVMRMAEFCWRKVWFGKCVERWEDDGVENDVVFNPMF